MKDYRLQMGAAWTALSFGKGPGPPGRPGRTGVRPKPGDPETSSGLQILKKHAALNLQRNAFSPKHIVTAV